MTAFRPRAVAVIAIAAISGGAAIAADATAKPDHKPKPKPKLTLLTTTEEAALSKQAIKVAVESKAGEQVRVEATFVVDGFPEDFVFRLGPEKKRLRDHAATVKLRLSPRKREVLDFAIKSCRGASLDLQARAAKRTGRLSADLATPGDCTDTT
jgi:hypothetical protein